MPTEAEPVKVVEGDAIDGLAGLPADSVHCCVTSPPYYGLRSYLPNGVRLKPSLTPEQLAYVLAELDRLGIKPEAHTTG
jgi:DNA modification methylase